jgi:hypothetical protein
MRSAEADAKLAARQLSLVAALVAGGTPPAGVDPERVRIQALALVRKRSRSVARCRPELAASLGADFWPAFQRYAAADPTPSANSSSDAKRFARYVRKSRRSQRLTPHQEPSPRAGFGARRDVPAAPGSVLSFFGTGRGSCPGDR